MKYLRLWFNFFKISLMAESEYRLNMIIKVTGDIVWYATQLCVFEVLFYHAPQIGGWDIQSMRVFMGILFIVDASYMILLHDNFEHAPTMIRKGELDFVLAKPINSQFMFSLRKVTPVYFINMMMVFVYLGWAISQLPVPPTPTQYFVTFILMVSGLVVLYSMRFFFAALNVVFTNASSLTYIWYQFYRLGTRPHALYPSWLRWMVLTIFPVGLISSVPATTLVHGLSWKMVVASPMVAAFLLWMTTRYWRSILRYYSSASS